MARYKITITLNIQPTDNETLIIDSPASTELFFFEFYESGQPIPSINPVEIGTTLQQTAYNLYLAHRFNYNLTGIYDVTRGTNWLAIEGEFANAPVEGGGTYLGGTVVVTALNPQLVINSTTIVAGTNVCNYLDIDIVGNQNFNELIDPYAAVFADTTTYTVTNRQRGSVAKITIKDSNGSTATKNVQLPSYLNTGLIDVQVVNNTVTVIDATTGLTLEYSLDDLNWQGQNTFNGLTGGDYTLYIRDQFGCKINTAFSIEEGVDGVIIIPDPYFLYPKGNPVRMAKKETWDNINILKNSKNTLSCEGQEDIVYKELHYYNQADTFTLQMRSNYSDLDIVTTDDSQSQTLIQKTNNIGVKTSIDCKVIDLGNNSFGVYFISGNIYDYDTGTDTGDDYILNGELPEFGVIGNIITINSLNYTIDDITFNEDLNYWQLNINSTALANGDYIVKSIFNVLPYEVYECTIALSGRTEFQIEISFNGGVRYTSELIRVDNDDKYLSLMKWSMDYNTDIMFSTGFEGVSRVKVDTITARIKNENEKYETDADVIQTDSSDYEVDEIKFFPATKETAKALINWLSHSNIEIRGISYVKDKIEIEELGRSNLYVITATLILKGTGLYEDALQTSSVNIPEILETENNEFITI